ncbi:hypothetical protein RDWZM_004295 [Blomia tropicalis]|uniref:Uncharacterized protein n=1 Tax=Blomia tropicalis TaxID=40697 RepID=A0A9Q0MGU7_BLOTA|nr:hypothetical protein RDWZM_004295 [Blomia tropicalis]
MSKSKINTKTQEKLIKGKGLDSPSIVTKNNLTAQKKIFNKNDQQQQQQQKEGKKSKSNLKISSKVSFTKSLDVSKKNSGNNSFSAKRKSVDSKNHHHNKSASKKSINNEEKRHKHDSKTKVEVLSPSMLSTLANSIFNQIKQMVNQSQQRVSPEQSRMNNSKKPSQKKIKTESIINRKKSTKTFDTFKCDVKIELVVTKCMKLDSTNVQPKRSYTKLPHLSPTGRYAKKLSKSKSKSKSIVQIQKKTNSKTKSREKRKSKPKSINNDEPKKKQSSKKVKPGTTTSKASLKSASNQNRECSRLVKSKTIM